MESLVAYSWSGNVRDLENVAQNAMILARNGIINHEDLPPRVRGYADDPSALVAGDEELGGFVSRISEQAERKLIIEALKRNDNSRSRTAEALGMSRKTLFNKLRKYGIEP